MKDLCKSGRSAINLLLLIAIFEMWILIPIEGTEAEINSEVTTLAQIFHSNLARDDPDGPPRPWSLGVDGFKGSLDIRHIGDLPVLAIWNLSEADIELGVRTMRENPDGTPERPIDGRDVSGLPNSVTPAGIAYGRAVLNRLKSLIDSSGVPIDGSTMGDVERRFMRVIELPFVKQKVNVTNASWVLQLILLAPLSLLFVLLESLWMLLRQKPQKEIENLDLIFFYPSVAAYVLGIIWLVAPVLLVAWGMRHFLSETHTTLQIWIAVSAAAVMLGMIGIIWRRVHQIRKKTYSVTPEEPPPAEPEEEEDDKAEEGEIPSPI